MGSRRYQVTWYRAACSAAIRTPHCRALSTSPQADPRGDDPADGLVRCRLASARPAQPERVGRTTDHEQVGFVERQR